MRLSWICGTLLCLAILTPETVRADLIFLNAEHQVQSQDQASGYQSNSTIDALNGGGLSVGTAPGSTSQVAYSSSSSGSAWSLDWSTSQYHDGSPAPARFGVSGSYAQHDAFYLFEVTEDATYSISYTWTGVDPGLPRLNIFLDEFDPLTGDFVGTLYEVYRPSPSGPTAFDYVGGSPTGLLHAGGLYAITTMSYVWTGPLSNFVNEPGTAEATFNFTAENIQTSPVPEPSSMALLGLGLMSVAVCAIRRTQSVSLELSRTPFARQ